MRFKSITYILLALLLQVASRLCAQEIDPPFLKFTNHPWVDSVFNSLSPEEKIGQLIWIDAYSNNDIGQIIWLNDVIKKAGVGGIVFFEGCAGRQAEMLNYFQKISKVPLIIAEDGEWGQGMRFDGVVKFPYRMTLGAIQNDSLIYLMGKTVAEQFKRAGVHINIAPVADVNNNSLNPVIDYRSFGENPENVSRKTLMYMNGLQDNGIISAAKHFPEPGDIGLLELTPFRSLINTGGTGIMSLKAGLDVLESVDDPVSTIKEISDGIKKGSISQDVIDEKCRKVLAAKYWAGLYRCASIIEEKLQEDLSPATTKAIIRELYANALTVLRNENDILPVRNLEKTRLATISINNNKTTFFQYRISKYQPADK